MVNKSFEATGNSPVAFFEKSVAPRLNSVVRVKGMIMFSKEADIFFEQPSSNRRSPGDFGVLYRLRRDIFLCMGIDPDSLQAIPYAALWPGTMGILAGVDLLAKFYDGSDQINGVGPRFRKFIHEYFRPISPGDADTVYQLRNSLLHSFGLYSETANGKKYQFVLGQDLGRFISSLSRDVYLVDIRELHQRFESAVSQYQNDLENSTTLQGYFATMFPKYGAIRIG